MSDGINIRNWYALQVRCRWETPTADLLTGKGYPVFLPRYQVKKRSAGRVREISTPFFPGYVFCQLDPQNRLPVLVTPGVITIVSRGRVPLPVDDDEITAIRRIVSSGLRPEPWPYLEIGQRVRIESDALEGLQGILISFKGTRRIVVSVTLLRRSVALEIERFCVRPILAAQPKPVERTIPASLLERAVS